MLGRGSASKPYLECLSTISPGGDAAGADSQVPRDPRGRHSIEPGLPAIDVGVAEFIRKSDYLRRSVQKRYSQQRSYRPEKVPDLFSMTYPAPKIDPAP